MVVVASIFGVFVQIADHGFYVVHGNSWLLWSQNKYEKKLKQNQIKYQQKPFVYFGLAVVCFLVLSKKRLFRFIECI